MKTLQCTWPSYTCPAHVQKVLDHAIEGHAKQSYGTYTAPYHSIGLPFDQTYINKILDVAQEKKKLNPSAFVLIGIGGSSLGTQAVWQAVSMYVDKQSLSFFCAETVDPDQMFSLIEHIDALLAQGKKIIINVVSKSGTTTETIVNFEILLSLLKKYHPKNYTEYVIVTTDRDSALWRLAHDISLGVLEVPTPVGGRYSVFSAVGLFPLAMLGINIDELLAGARHITEACLSKSYQNNPAAQTAALLYCYATEQTINIADLFLFSTHLEHVGKWYRQLMAESIGKIRPDGTRVGITPTVSIGSSDLHSMVQLYVAGPRSRFTTFVTVDTFHADITIPSNELPELVPGLQKKSMATIMHAIAQGVQRTYQKQSLPHILIRLPDTQEATLGQFLQYNMIMMMYLGALFDINPFDQPQVELYKEETRRILSNE